MGRPLSGLARRDRTSLMEPVVALDCGAKLQLWLHTYLLVETSLVMDVVCLSCVVLWPLLLSASDVGA